MQSWAQQNPNDAFHSHAPQTNSRSVRRAPEAREMTNPAADPFMVSQVRGMANRPRVKVRVVAAKGLPERGANVVTYATCMAKNKKTSMFRTRDAYDSRDPIWDEAGGQMVMRWVPGDVLCFRVYDKDRSGCMPGLTSSEVMVAQCEILSDEYFPSGLATNLPLFNSGGYPIAGAQLVVEVQIYGVEGAGLGGKLRNICTVDIRKLKDMAQHAPETAIALWFELIGEPVDDRTKGDMGMLILIPCLLFLLLTWCGWLVRHYNTAAVAMLNGFAVCVAVGLIVLGTTTHKKSKTPFFAIGGLMVIAVLLASFFSDYGWSECWRQYWWMHTGLVVGADAGTPAERVSDAASISFQNVKNSTAWTSVDASRAAGYRKGDIYCAAPILDPNVALGDIMRVEFWAIGINCCDDFGSFTCDASREIAGSVGVVMKGGGMPCSDCHAEEFRLATLKAAGVSTMVSAPGALYVRYVKTAKTIEDIYLAKCVFSFFWSLIFGVVFFALLGFFTNYKGWGKTGHFPLYNLLTPKRPQPLLPPEMQAKRPVGPVEEDPDEKKFTLVLAPSTRPGEFSIAARGPEEQVGNYATL